MHQTTAPQRRTTPTPLDTRRPLPVTRGRALHLVDLENLLGIDRDAASVGNLWSEYCRTVGVGPDDALVVGTERRWAARAWFALPMTGLRRVVGYGVDGADNALLASIDPDHDLDRFPTLIIGSGDHAFAPLARQARSRGCAVEVAIGGGQLSRELAASATSIHCLPSWTLLAA